MTHNPQLLFGGSQDKVEVFLLICAQLVFYHGAEGSFRLVPLEELLILSRTLRGYRHGDLRSHTRDLVETLEATPTGHAWTLKPFLYRMLHEDFTCDHLSR